MSSPADASEETYVLPEIPVDSRLSFEPASPPGLSTSPDQSTSALSSVSSLQSPASSSDSHGSRVLLPVPTLSNNGSEASFSFSEVDVDGGPLDPLPPEIGTADLSIAPDGSFVETSSGAAARELKKRYDQHYGVNVSVRSPYAITALINQHGKKVYRVGTREKKTPPAAATSVDIDERVSQATVPSESPRARSPRRSRLSVTMFNKTGSVSGRPQTAGGPGPRKLRKTRSFSEMTSASPSTSTNAPPRATGRGHSQSVTAADFMGPPRSTTATTESSVRHVGDMFADVMGWIPSTGSSASLSSQGASSSSRGHTLINNPFGPTIAFESPSRKPNVEFLPTPRLLREMQSFESGLTARQADMETSFFDEASINGSDGSRPRSAFRVRDSTSAASFFTDSEFHAGADSRPASSVPFSPKPETELYSRYSTDVFDVLQTYRGLPLLDKLAPGDETTVIKMSLSSDNTAAPRDDPRFVIWGELIPEGRDRDLDEVSQGSHSQTDGSSSAPSSSISKKPSVKSSKKGKAAAVPEAPPMLKLSSMEEGGGQKVLVAATIERWIAQLTSELNYDELLNFFLTYRTYIKALDLCHLLISRFHWALQQPQPMSTHDEMVRRVVRVRTFVAIRYWLLTFFTVDFLPDRELRLLVAHWLNTLIRDPILTKHADGLSIVRKLKKVAKDCKQVHTRSQSKPKGPKQPRPTSVKVAPSDTQGHVLGESFAAATRKVTTEEEDSDVDLDFLPEEQALLAPSDINGGDIANAHLSTVHLGSARTSTMPLSSISILQRTDPTADAQGAAAPFMHAQATLPIHHSTLSRVFVKTIGRLGRWRRVLNQRHTGVRTPLGACADVDAIDLELTIGRDLLTVNGDVEQYLRMIEQVPPVVRPSSVVPPVVPAAPPVPASGSAPTAVPATTVDAAPTTPPVVAPVSPSASSPPASAPKEASPEYAESVAAAPEPEPKPEPPVATDTASMRSAASATSDVRHMSSPARPDSLDSRPSSFRSTSTDSFGEPIASAQATFPAGAQSAWQFEVMSVDDLDLSDNSDEHANGDGPVLPPGLRQPVRRLPLRREFEFVRRSDSVSSMGLHSTGHSSAVSSTNDAEPIAGGAIHQWQMRALVDSLSDDEEDGDVQAALKRLEGEINHRKQKEKASKVDGWMRTMRERFLNGDYDDDEAPPVSDEEYEDYEEPSSNDDLAADVETDANDPYDITIVEPDAAEEERASVDAAGTPVPPAHQSPQSPPRPADEAKPAPEDAVPLEILQSRMPPGAVSPPQPSLNRAPVSKFVTTDTSRFHRSFILNHRAQVIAGHFAMIDRELFMGVKFEEVLDDWMACEDAEVLDWGVFLKERARLKSDPELADKISALAAVRARFNLMTNFIVSEVVMSPPHERHAVVAKFIRIAWHSYMLSSFNTLVAIITGLRCAWVSQAIKSWKGVGRYEMRLFNDLKEYVTSADDFKYIRQAIADTKSQDHVSVVSGDADVRASKHKSMTAENNKASTACVPFIGVYLSQLSRHNRLPDLIDPTAPTEAVGIDPITSNFDAPSHPEVFSALAPLPPSMHLEPLINVHKQRLIAGVIKSMVAGQHLASRFQYQIEKRLYQKCLRLRSLNAEHLQRILTIYPSRVRGLDPETLQRAAPSTSVNTDFLLAVPDTHPQDSPHQNLIRHGSHARSRKGHFVLRTPLPPRTPVRFLTGNKILRILKSQGLGPSIPEDLWHLIKKAVAVRKHLEVNRKDKDSKFRLILIESRIHRLARYYKTKQQIPPTFKYDSATASTLIA
ncbi:hypothetical protein MSAN_00570000 [Mycena sanguinolenta]|uniref:Ras GEF n=1 Tax=Mycena sanguinolenta TaxID=230812 RepID=A0A8H6ZC54_9AGAR|nr:hypothetical protein MSAN_00570000 [Mycena sanguinolenta]